MAQYVYLPTFLPLFQDEENYAGKLYTDVTLPVRESSMVVFGVVCVQMLPMRKIILSDNQVIFFFFFFFSEGKALQ